MVRFIYFSKSFSITNKEKLENFKYKIRGAGSTPSMLVFHFV